MDYQLGTLEFAFKLIDRKTGEEHVVVSTPAMWAMANDYQDKLMAEGEHTKGWIITKYVNVLAMLAAKKAGVIQINKGIPSLEAQAQFINDYEVSDVSHQYKADKEEDDAANPTNPDQEGGQAAE